MSIISWIYLLWAQNRWLGLIIFTLITGMKYFTKCRHNILWQTMCKTSSILTMFCVVVSVAPNEYTNCTFEVVFIMYMRFLNRLFKIFARNY